jgi:hypothetical protein
VDSNGKGVKNATGARPTDRMDPIRIRNRASERPAIRQDLD